jgi:ABC-type transporter Mla subunit MlaD
MWTRRETRSNLSRQLEQLRSEFESVSDNVNRLKSALRNETSSLSRYLPSAPSGISSLAANRFSDLGHAASNGADAVVHQVEALLGTASQQMRTRPVPAGLALLALGVAVGFLLRKM